MPARLGGLGACHRAARAWEPRQLPVAAHTGAGRVRGGELDAARHQRLGTVRPGRRSKPPRRRGGPELVDERAAHGHDRLSSELHLARDEAGRAPRLVAHEGAWRYAYATDNGSPQGPTRTPALPTSLGRAGRASPSSTRMWNRVGLGGDDLVAGVAGLVWLPGPPFLQRREQSLPDHVVECSFAGAIVLDCREQVVE